MKLTNISFPHPVLGIGDSVLGSIDVTHTIVQTDDTYDCHFSCHMTDECIQKLIDAGKAKYYCEVTCSSTLYRESLTYTEPEFDFVVGRKDVRGTVEILLAIVAVENIPRYVNTNISPLYQEFDSFYVEEGDLLAAFQQLSFEADIQYEKLKAVSQIFVVTGNNQAKGVNIDLEGDTLIVDMHPDIFALFVDESINKNSLYAPLFHASIVLNALIEALRNLETHENSLWAKTIKYRLESEQDEHPVYKNWKDVERHNEIAQVLLNNPYDSMLRAIKIIDDKFRAE